MNFSEVLILLKKGCKIGRQGWADGTYIKLQNLETDFSQPYVYVVEGKACRPPTRTGSRRWTIL